MDGPDQRSIAGVVLAAGAGRRMGRPKAELVVDEVRLLDRAVDVLSVSGCDPLIAVVREGTEVGDVVAVVNPDPDRGMRSSLKLAVDEVMPAEVDAVAVLLVDLPGIRAGAARAVIDAWRPGRIAVGVIAGRRTHPTVMSPAMWAEAIAVAEADEGARRYLAAHPELVDEIEIIGDPRDLDTPADLAAWNAETSEK